MIFFIIRDNIGIGPNFGFQYNGKAMNMHMRNVEFNET